MPAGADESGKYFRSRVSMTQAGLVEETGILVKNG